ncbi:MAG TPA: YdcF family protein [Methyloversatilis sp.]
MLASLLFVLKKAVAALLLPPASPLMLSVAGLLLALRHRRAGLAMAGGGLLLLYALCTPALSGMLERSTYATRTAAPTGALAHAQAIVILGAGTTDNLVDYGGQTVNAYALERLRAGARLARITRLPVLVSGGVVWDGRPEADMMKEVMDEFGVPVRWVESRSRDTADNARESAALLHAAGLNRVALVTHAFHMRRAMEEFRRAGLEPVAAPTLIRQASTVRAVDFIPGVRALQQSGAALHEWLGWAALALRRT